MDKIYFKFSGNYLKFNNVLVHLNSLKTKYISDVLIKLPLFFAKHNLGLSNF